MADPITIFAAISAGFETLKKGLEVYKEGGAIKDAATLRERVLEWRTQVVELKDQVLSLRETMQTLKQENLELRENLAQDAKSLEQAHAVGNDDQYRLCANGLWLNKNNQRFCPKCKATRKEWIAMVKSVGAMVSCPVCGMTCKGN